MKMLTFAILLGSLLTTSVQARPQAGWESEPVRASCGINAKCIDPEYPKPEKVCLRVGGCEEPRENCFEDMRGRYRCIGPKKVPVVCEDCIVPEPDQPKPRKGRPEVCDEKWGCDPDFKKQEMLS